VLKFLSVNSIVIAPANTGNDPISNPEVTSIAHMNNGALQTFIELALFNNIVTVKLIDPINEAAPAKCKANIAKSTDGPE
jgi:hypothetical protein